MEVGGSFPLTSHVLFADNKWPLVSWITFLNVICQFVQVCSQRGFKVLQPENKKISGYRAIQIIYSNKFDISINFQSNMYIYLHSVNKKTNNNTKWQIYTYIIYVDVE